MTRLKENDLEGLGENLKQYDLDLVRRTGLTLGQLACKAAGKSESIFTDKAIRVAVVPISTGEGVIPGFAESVCAIVSHLGCEAEVTSSSDVTGIWLAARDNYDILFLADDYRFIALSLRTKSMAENGEATARGYVTALEFLSGGLSGQEVLVVGAGEVGTVAIACLQELGAKVSVLEVDEVKIAALTQAGINAIYNRKENLASYQFIVDASPQGDFLDLSNLHSQAAIAAPGIPFGLTKAAHQVFKNRVIHDPLELGVATMLAMVMSED